jgi:hypothetical protein
MVYRYPTSINEAALLLDKIDVKWYEKITLPLNMKEYRSCILGQIGNGYYSYFKELFGYSAERVHSTDRIFGTYTNRDDWKQEINKRRNTMKHDFNWALEQLLNKKAVKRASWSNGQFWEYKNGQVYTSDGSIVELTSGQISNMLEKDWMLDSTCYLSHLKPGDKFRYKLDDTVYTLLGNPECGKYKYHYVGDNQLCGSGVDLEVVKV